jgi:hypothetical protein
MSRFKPLVLVLVAVFALGAVVAASASARGTDTPEITPIGSFTDNLAPGTTAALVGKGIFRAVSEVVCTSAPSTGSFQTSLLGAFKVLFRGCLVSEVLLLLCKGSTATEASAIETTGTFHLRYLNSAKKVAVIAYLIVPVKFTCVNGETKVEIETRGCAAGEVGPINTEIRLPNFLQNTLKKVARTTRNEITKIENEAGNGEETCALESKEGTKSFESAAETITDNIYPLTATSEIIT